MESINRSNSTDYFTPEEPDVERDVERDVELDVDDFGKDKDKMLDRLKTVSDSGIKEYAFQGVKTGERKKRENIEKRIDLMLVEKAKENEKKMVEIRGKMRNLYLKNGDPRYPPHSGSRGVAEFNTLLQQRKSMFGFTNNFDDYRNITDLDVLKDMYMKMKSVYREKQPTKKVFEKPVNHLKRESMGMPLHRKISTEKSREMRNKMAERALSVDTLRDNATKMLLPLASRKVRKKVTANMNEKYRGGRSRRKGTRHKGKGTRHKGKRSSTGTRHKGKRSSKRSGTRRKGKRSGKGIRSKRKRL